MVSDIANAVLPVISAFGELGVEYLIGRSVASSAYGVPRSTLDVDMVVSLEQNQVAGLVTRLEKEYHSDPDAVSEAVQRRSSFNLIHLASMIKIDLFELKDGPYDRMAFSRRRTDTFENPNGSAKVCFSTAEDVILSKLDRYRQGGETSQRQWRDVVGVLKVQGDALDRAYLDKWSVELDVKDLLGRARRDAGQT